MDDASRLSHLSSRMREEWDRRVAHDYRYWMSDGVENDELMWKCGERDLELLFSGLPPSTLSRSTVLELGCGVGRLLRAAARRCAVAVGVDVSVEALATARRLLSDLPNVRLVHGDGVGLSSIDDDSLDGAFSFAALGSMPVAVFAAYLLELNRVVRVGGFLRLQVYLGRPQETVEEDTIVLRSFDRGCFERAVRAAGFRLEGTRELVLPFEVSDPASGLVAVIAELVREDRSTVSAEALTETLLPGGERRAGTAWSGSQTGYLMALARAKQHMDVGAVERARQAIMLAVEQYSGADEDVKSLLADLEADINAAVRPAPSTRTAQAVPVTRGDPSIFQRNLEALRLRFPATAELIAQTAESDECSTQRTPTGEAVLLFRGVPLSHSEKPIRAAETWAVQTVNTPRLRDAKELVIGGCGMGYHVEALLARSAATIHLFEPSPQVLRAAMALRDLRPIFDRIGSLTCTVDALRDELGDGRAGSASECIIYPPCRTVSPEGFEGARRAIVSMRGINEIQPRIAVVGPMYGGSLPIAYYATRAFQSLKQRVHGFDFKTFYKPFCELGASLKTPSRKDAIESKFVELLSDALLESLTERPVDILVCLAQAPVSPRVLIELRKRGVITVMWFVEDYQRFLTWKMIAPYFDYMFMIQRGKCLEEVEAAGAGRALYLPVACDPMVHHPVALSPEEMTRYGSEISFLGAGYNNRRHVFAFLANRDFKIWGTEWPACMPFTKLVQDAGRRIEPEEYVKIFSASTINLNLHSSAERDGVEPFGDFVNPRTFELAASGAFQLVDERTLLPELFEIGREVSVFHDAGEMIDRIDHYASRPEERRLIVEASRRRVLSEHTYHHRMRQMLECIYIDRIDQLRSRAASSPWHSTLEAGKDVPALLPRLQKAYERGDDPTLDSLVGDIQTGKGTLSDAEQKILFLHHLRSQIATVQELRKEKV